MEKQPLKLPPQIAAVCDAMQWGIGAGVPIVSHFLISAGSEREGTEDDA